MAAAERSRSPMGGSPVPACMFAPEPGSPGGGPRVAAAACPLRAAFDAEDGEALNGEPEIDLTSKLVMVSPTSEQYDSLLQQMSERIDEGCGETIYVIGQGSDGTEYGLMHCGSIRQTATILSMDKDCLRTGDKATVHFRFIKTPEYLHIDQRLVFREGRTKAVGTITKLLQTTNNSPMNSKPQQIKMQSTKKGAVTKREDGVPPAGTAAGGPLAGDESPSTAAAPLTPTALQPLSKVGGGGRRRGGQRHKVKSQGACVTPASGC
uniref:GTP binding protein 1 n=1 Tax=Strix occidentalis caurina TaxID=311401 RepID=A0A8D0F984_STROC